MKKLITFLLALIMVFSLISCSSPDTETAPEAEPETTGSEIDYMALVNKLNPLPEGWEENLQTIHMTNSVGDDVEVEAKAY